MLILLNYFLFYSSNYHNIFLFKNWWMFTRGFLAMKKRIYLISFLSLLAIFFKFIIAFIFFLISFSLFIGRSYLLELYKLKVNMRIVVLRFQNEFWAIDSHIYVFWDLWLIVRIYTERPNFIFLEYWIFISLKVFKWLKIFFLLIKMFLINLQSDTYLFNEFKL